MADPKVGTGKKPKGSDEDSIRMKILEDTVSIKYATVKDAKENYCKS